MSVTANLRMAVGHQNDRKLKFQAGFPGWYWGFLIQIYTWSETLSRRLGSCC